jgi:myo-inositol 2-dehydrogenase / D-chiro-inositol 1-dehydrogenase
VRIGLLGCGRIARMVHLGVLTRLPGARVVAIAEADAERRAAASGAVGARAHADWRELLQDDDVDAVVITLPNSVHAEAAVATFERGLHAYIEKPVATTAADARRVVAAWRTSEVVGMPGFNYRFHPMHVAARRMVGDGVLGEIVAVRSAFTSPARPLPPWQQSRSTGGGVLLNLGSHHADLIPFLIGSPASRVTASLRSVRGEQDVAAVTMQLRNGVPVQSLFAMCAAAVDTIELVGVEATLVLDRLGAGRPRLVRTETTSSRPLGAIGELQRGLAVGGRAWRALRGNPEPSYRIALERFIAAAATGTNAAPDMTDGLVAALVLDAAERSAAGNGEVAVELS